jgi:hypothetical protein
MHLFVSAFALRNYWALIILSSRAKRLFFLVLSYRILFWDDALSSTFDLLFALAPSSMYNDWSYVIMKSLSSLPSGACSVLHSWFRSGNMLMTK